MSYRDPSRTYIDHEAASFRLFSIKQQDKPKATPPSYSAPGHVGDLADDQLRALWNATIANEFDKLTDYGSRFFELDPTRISDATVVDAVKWGADPAEPNFCLNRTEAIKLSDWDIGNGHPIHAARGVLGRREVHNEYCEYVPVYTNVGTQESPDIKLKRVIFTTELREYWMMLAEHAPNVLAQVAREVVGRAVSWEELYGPGVADPVALTQEDRRRLFAVYTAGAAGDDALLGEGVPTYPIGVLNNRHALFMYHPINGLDDLLYIVMFGAHPYARRSGSEWVMAQKDEIFSGQFFDEKKPPKQLACRHADPAAATNAARLAFEGRTVAIADPLGMYIRTFADAKFRYNGSPIPQDWVRFSRGENGLFQRLEFGPPDDHVAVLNDIEVGDEGERVTGGFQIAEQMEVGPSIAFGLPSSVSDDEYTKFTVQETPPISCGEAEICRKMRRLKDEFDERTQG